MTASLCLAQEQQHRLSLQAELDTAESAASDLRQMLAMYFGDSPSCSPDSTSTRYQSPVRSSDPTWQASPLSRLQSGLPGTLDRRDSRLQMDLAGIQKRLHKIAQLRDTPPSSPRSADRISAWASPSDAESSPRSGGLGRSRTFASRLSPVKQSPLRATTMNLGHYHDHATVEQDDAEQAEPHARFADDQPDSAEQLNSPDGAEPDADKADSSPQLSRLNDAVSLDSSSTDLKPS